MIKRILLLAMVLLLVVGCGAKPSKAPEKVTFEIDLGSDFTPNVIEEVIVDGVFNFQPIKDSSFIMDYEPRTGSAVRNHFGLEFGFPTDTNWLGDDETKAKFDINEYGTDVFGYVTITTAPQDFKEYYQTEDLKEIAVKVNEEFLTSEKYYDELKAEVDSKGFEIVMEGQGLAFPDQDIWYASYIEYKDTENNTRSMRLYLCDNEINEKFYCMEVTVDVPEDDAERIEKYRSIVFSLQAMSDGTIAGSATVG